MFFFPTWDVNKSLVKKEVNKVIHWCRSSVSIKSTPKSTQVLLFHPSKAIPPNNVPSRWNFFDYLISCVRSHRDARVVSLKLMMIEQKNSWQLHVNSGERRSSRNTCWLPTHKGEGKLKCSRNGIVTSCGPIATENLVQNHNNRH